MTLDVYNTHMELYPYQKDDYPAIEDMYTATAKFNGANYPCGYIIAEGKLYLPRGTHIAKIERMTRCETHYINDSDPITPIERKIFPIYEPRDEVQEESVKFLMGTEHQLALNLATGAGKGHPNFTKIPTPTKNGYTLLGDLKVGDKVFDEHGNPTEVLRIFELGVKDIYKVTFADGRISLCTDEHLWLCKPDKTAEYSVRMAKDIYECYQNDVDAQMYIPTSGMVEYPYRQVPDPYTVGMNISMQESEIPPEYLYNHPSVRKALLQGLLRSLLNVSTYPYIGFKSSNRLLLEQIRELMFMNGHSATLNEDSDILMCDVSDSEDIMITNIELVEPAESRCIMVNNQSHLYLTEDFIVTHNTFCVAYASTMLNERTLVITPNEGIKQQWIKTYHNMIGFQPRRLVNIAGSEIIRGLMTDVYEDADIYFVNHATLRNYMVDVGGYEFHQFFKKMGFGIKVYDESHMDFANIILIDHYTNTNRTWYLTATFDRSDKTESRCFRQAFNSVKTYGELESQATMRKHVQYHVVYANTMIAPKQRATLMAYPGFTASKYGKYIIFGDTSMTVYRTILEILKKTDKLDGKTLIFVPIIAGVDEVVKRLKKDFSHKSIGAYHSAIPKDEKESAMDKDIIVSTIKSCGTGFDMKGLRVVINTEPLASKVVAQQLIGRLRPYAEDKDTYFFDIVATDIQPVVWWWRARFKKINTLVKSVTEIKMD